MATKKRLIDANELVPYLWALFKFFGSIPCTEADKATQRGIKRCIGEIKKMPTVDAVVLPKGKPGDYLEWDNGTGFKQIYAIQSVMICENCMRYELENFAPVVNHPGIVRIMSLEQAEREWKEMCERAKAKEEPTMTAGVAEDGN